MIITIDGPAGAGKSTVAKRLAKQLTSVLFQPFEYLDTGSMYRAAALLGLRNGVDWNEPAQLETLAQTAKIEIDAGRTFLNGEDITDAVRTKEVTGKIRYAADNPVIRRQMVELQRAVAKRYAEEGKGLVSEGRDQGTVVFPDTPFKFFVSASPEERARRRLGEMAQRGETGDFDEVLKSINERDYRDSVREVAPLREPKDARRIITDGMTIDEAVETIVQSVSMTLTLRQSVSR
ncbi:MAG: (d)CMP kinase [Planctomycetaceae bacterium]|jgi:cytidylate kinase|nr:(d)CMP kinase [Planctomycetaceae bacterium]